MRCSTLSAVQSSDAIPQPIEDFAFSTGHARRGSQAVFACNSYIDEQAPWVLRKTDPSAWQTVLATLYICIAILAVAIRPIIPAARTAARQHGSDGRAEDVRGILGHWYRLLPKVIRLNADAAFPAPRAPRGRGGSGVRLIDSHCHLNYEGLVERQAEVLEKARDRGVSWLPQHLDSPAGMGRHYRRRGARTGRVGERRRASARGRCASRPRLCGTR